MEKILTELRGVIYDGDDEKANELARQALDQGIDPMRLINEAMKPALDKVGEAYDAGEFALPEIVCCGDAALAVGDLVDKALGAGKGMVTKGTFAVGTVKGDIHSIGKSVVATMMKVSGYKVIDLGVDVSPEEFLEAAENGADIIGMSGLVSLSIKSMEASCKLIQEKYPETRIILGGAAIDPSVAKVFGVMYGSDAASCPKILQGSN